MDKVINMIRNSQQVNSENKNIAVFVLWQSLVVKAYRSFFEYLTQNPSWRVACAAPQKFRELGSQEIQAEDFQKPFAKDDPNYPFFLLKSWNLHVQIVIYWGLGKALKKFFNNNKNETRYFICLADPYSVTAFFSWCVARLYLGKDFHFMLFALQNIYKKYPWPLRFIQNFLFKHSYAILSLGTEQSEILRQHGYKGKIMDYPLWFDSKLFRYENISRKNEKIRISYAGSLFVEKGVLDILDAMKFLSSSTKENCEFRFVGRGPLQGEIEKRCAELEKDGFDIQFLGALSSDQIKNYYHESDILLIPSRTAPHWKEQFGRVIVEAQACGVRVLGSNSGAIPHVIADETCIFQEADLKDIVRVIEAHVQELGKVLDRETFRKKLSQEAFLRYADISLAKVFSSNLIQEIS